MSNYIYYPKAPITVDALASQLCPIGRDKAKFTQRLIRSNRNISHANTLCNTAQPIHVPGAEVSQIQLEQLLHLPPQSHKLLQALTETIGGGGVMGLAEFLYETHLADSSQQLKLFGGKGLSASNQACNAILVALDNYDRALEHYFRLQNNGVSNEMLRGARNRLQSSFEKYNILVNSKSQALISKYTGFVSHSHLHPTREAFACIPIVTSTDLSKVVNLTKHAKIVAPSLLRLSQNSQVKPVIAESLFTSAKTNIEQNLTLPNNLSNPLAKGTVGAVSAISAITSVGLTLSLIMAGSFNVHLKQSSQIVDRL